MDQVVENLLRDSEPILSYPEMLEPEVYRDVERGDQVHVKIDYHSSPTGRYCFTVESEVQERTKFGIKIATDSGREYFLPYRCRNSPSLFSIDSD